MSPEEGVSGVDACVHQQDPRGQSRMTFLLYLSFTSKVRVSRELAPPLFFPESHGTCSEKRGRLPSDSMASHSNESDYRTLIGLRQW